jgi:Holliday junction resolvasome RuvABC endonuclease subunit
MTYVLGLDLSLTSTGWAVIAHTPELTSAHCGTHTSKPTDNTWEARRHRLETLADRITAGTEPPTLALLEGPSYGSGRQAGVHDRAGLWWAVYERLHAHHIPTAVVPPATRAKFATTRGNAGKTEVGVAIARLWPDIDARTDDEWDALALATIGAQHLGWNVPTRAHHAAALAAVAWPTRDDATAQQIAQAG